ncbi:hypothetical protein [Colwellia echini]|uniref:Mannitol repressor n=1 Tax=Colwellia echini TaxID=1982103 RepID=A0ABY3MSM5_9GAMM|nr:hypothetical protein [Colwellia echini]TYK64206.1 hypothetical protein CWS31_016915 [Colwellia echini]
MSFDTLSFDELDEHAMERLIFDEEEISPILKGHIFIEKILETLISSNLQTPQALFKRTRSFELKVDLALAMGLIDQKYFSAFKAINNIRNNYAHKHDYKVTIKELSGFKFDWEPVQNKAFDVACSKGAGEAVRLATIFLTWKAIHLIKQPNA